MNTMSKAMITGASVLALLLGATSAQAEGRLKAPIADWTGGHVTCTVAELILERELDYKVERISMPSGTNVAEAIAAGDLDFACENWPSYNTWNAKMIEKYGGDGSVVYLGDTGVVGISSYYVPKYFIDEVAPDLASLEQLNKYKEHFATLETGGKGRLIACPTPAWECADQDRLDLHGVDFVAVELGSETAAWAEAQAAYARKEPFLLYAWEPHWIHAALELVPLKLPDYDADKWPATGWAEDVTFNYANPDFPKDHPGAAAVLGNMNLTNLEQGKMVLAIDVDGRDIYEVVNEWLDKNEDVWKSWL